MAFTSYSHFHRRKILRLRDLVASIVPQNFQVVKMLENGDFSFKTQQADCEEQEQEFIPHEVFFFRIQKFSKLLSNYLSFKLSIVSI